VTTNLLAKILNGKRNLQIEIKLKEESYSTYFKLTVKLCEVFWLLFLDCLELDVAVRESLFSTPKYGPKTKP
jgi:hypothetical protein